MKKTISFILIFALVLSFGIATAVFADEGTVYEKLFKSKDVVFTRNENALDGDGYDSGLLATAKNNGKIVLEKFSGEFIFDGRVVSSEYALSDLTRIDFNFQNLDNNQAFTLSFQEKNSSVNAIVFIKEGDIFVSQITDTTFDNRLSALTFGFDNESLELYLGRGEEKTPIIDFDNEKDATKLSMNSGYDKFVNYSVTITFKQVKSGHEGKLNIYAISSQEFGGSVWVDTKAPVIYDDIIANGGVVGEEYDLNSAIVPTFDLTDGYKTEFKGIISVIDADGNPVTVENGKFTPDKVGAYRVTYTPTDSADNVGESVQASFKVYATKQNLDIEYAYPMENQTLGAGDKIMLPNAIAKTNIGYVPVCLVIEKDGSVIEKIADVSEIYELSLEKGTYTVTYSSDDKVGTSKSESYTLNVLDIPYVQSTNVSTDIGLGNHVSFEGTVALHSSGYYPVTTVITAPNGESGTFSTYTPTTSGTYKVEHLYDFNGNEYRKIQYFNVSIKESDLWENVKGMKFESGVKSAEYSDFSYKGVLLTARIANSKAVYKPIVDVTDNTTKSPIFECIVAPVAVGQIELTEFYVLLTDKETGDYICITTYFNPWPDSQSWTGDHVAHIYVTKNTKSRTDLTPVRVIANNIGKNEKNYPNQSIRYYYDYETNSIYVGYKITANTYCSKVIGLSDIGFAGFTKGEAELSVEFSQLNSSTANILVLNVDGQSTDKVYHEDKVGPEITVDFESNPESNLPVGIAGKNYPYFSATALDAIDGKVPVEAKVYYVQNGQSTLHRNLTATGFIPMRAGRYDIVYTACDYSGNTTERVVSVTVKLDSEVDDIAYDFGAIDDEIKIGTTYAIPQGTSSGGSGLRSVSYKVYLGNEEIEVYDGKYFDVEIAGVYSIKATVVDYLKQPVTFTHNLTVVASDEPVIKTLTMPKGLVKGVEFEFPAFTAKDYSSGVGVQIPVKWIVDGDELTDRKYTPSEVGIITAKAVAIGEAGETEKTYKLEVKDSGVVNSTKFNDGYFDTANLTQETVDSGIKFTATGDGSFTYLNNVIAQNALMKFTITELTQNKKIKIVLTDSINSAITQEFEVEKGEGNTVFNLTYNPTTKTVANGKNVVKVFEDFEGFASQKYQVKVDIPQGATVIVSSIGAQEFVGTTSFVEKFFISEGFDSTCDSGSLLFTASDRAQTTAKYFEFYKPIIADGSYFRLKVDKNNNSFTSFVVTMTDSKNEKIKVSYEVTRGESNQSTSRFTHAGTTVDCAGDWYGNTPAPFEFKYTKNGHVITDYNGNVVAELKYCDNGDLFRGFESGYFYLNIEMKGLEQDGFGTIALNSIMNQPFSKLVTGDVITPNASFKDEFKFAKYGETLVIPSLNAYDVLGEVTDIRLTITAPDGTKLLNNLSAWNGGSIEVNQYGTYKVEYVIFDNAGMRTTFSREFTVYDRVKPVITLSGNVPTTVKVGENLKLPQASVYDNNKVDIAYKVYVTTPNGSIITVTEQGFKVEEEGRYTVVYYAIDDDGAFDIQKFTFVAEKK